MSVPHTKLHQQHCNNLHSHKPIYYRTVISTHYHSPTALYQSAFQQSHPLPYCQFHTLSSTNNTVPICTTTTPPFNVLSVPHTTLHKYRWTNLHSHNPTIYHTVSSAHYTPKISLYQFALPQPHTLPYCQFHTLPSTNNNVLMCTLTTPNFTVMPVPFTKLHQQHCTNLHPHNRTIYGNVSSTNHTSSISLYQSALPQIHLYRTVSSTNYTSPTTLYKSALPQPHPLP